MRYESLGNRNKSNNSHERVNLKYHEITRNNLKKHEISPNTNIPLIQNSQS